MEGLFIVLGLIGTVIALIKVGSGYAKESKLKRDWKVFEDEIEPIFEMDQPPPDALVKVVKKLRKERKIPDIITIKFFGILLTTLYDELIVLKGIGDNKTKFKNAENDLSKLSSQVLRGYDNPKLAIYGLHEDTHVLDVSKKVWKYERIGFEGKKKKKRGMLFITLRNILFIPRGIEGKDFSFLADVAGGFDFGDVGNLLTTGLKLGRSLDAAAEKIGESVYFTKERKEELWKAFQKEGSAFISYEDITSVYVKSFLIVPSLWIVLKDGRHINFDSYDSPYQKPKETFSYYLTQLKILLNLNNRLLIPNKLENPDHWSVIPLDFSKNIYIDTEGFDIQFEGEEE